jgi:predicted TIM-barrel fold metal-dependent hydrolase
LRENRTHFRSHFSIAAKYTKVLFIMIDCHNHIGAELLSYLHGDFPYGQHLEDMVTHGGELGIRRWVVFPMVSNLSLNLDAMREGKITSDGALASVPYEFENARMMREIYDYFPDEGAKVWPFAMFDPNRNVAGQVAALRQLKEKYPFYGLKVQATIIQSPITGLNGEGGAFLDLCAEWDIPMLIHSSVLPSDIWSQASDIVDIAKSRPDVRFNIAHSCRFDRTQLDRIAELPNAWFDCSAHRIHCDLAIKESAVVAPPDRRFKSDYNSPSIVLNDLAAAYPGKMMWGSDSPYYSWVAMAGDAPYSLRSTYDLEVGTLLALPVGVQHEVSETNTLAWLKL